MSPEPTPPEPQAAQATKAIKARMRRRWRYTLIGTGVMVLLFALASGLVGTLFWAAGNSAGTAWLLARLSLAGVGVEVIEPQGTLIGDLKARQVIVTIGSATRIVIDKPVWRGASVSYTHDANTWARVHLQSLAAERVTVTHTSSGGKPAALPQHLRLPLELLIDDVHADEVRVPGLEDRPLRDVHTRLQLGGEHGKQHRLDAISLRLDPLLITGQVHLGAEAPMLLDAQLQAKQSSAAPTADQAASAAKPTAAWSRVLHADWQAQAQAHGPLARFNAQATLRSLGQSLDASAVVAPAERWPLPQLDATTQGLDLSALLDHAPLTALGGSVHITPAGKDAPNVLNADIQLSNAKPGRWDMRQLPLRSLKAAGHARTDRLDPLELTQFDAVLSDGRRDVGSLQGSAHWNASDFAVQALLTQVQPGAIDARLAAMTLSGPITLSGKTPPPTSGAAVPPSFTALADLNGKLNDPPRPVQLKLDASGTADHIELRELRAAAGGAQATLTGTADHAKAEWQLKAKAALVDFDPKPWFPAGPGLGWQDGKNKLNLHSELSLDVPDAALQPGDKPTPMTARLALLRGELKAHLDDSVLAGVPTSGDVTLRHTNAADALLAHVSLDVGGNQIKLDGQVAADAQGSKDHWTAEAHAPALASLAPLLRLVAPAGQAAELVNGLGGTLNADAQLSGRWPEISTQGKANLNAVHAGPWTVGQGDVHWQVGSTADAPLDIGIEIAQAAWSNRQLAATTLQLKGSGRSHDFSLRTELKAAPPVWVDSLQPGEHAQPVPVAAQAGASAPAAALPHTLATVTAHGSLSGNLFASASTSASASASESTRASANLHSTDEPWAWKGTLQQLDVRTTQAGATPLLVTKNVGLELSGGATPRAAVTAGRADILGAGLHWSRIEWEANRGVKTQQLDMQAELEPLDVAPLLRRIQPNFGWGGDLQIGGKVVIHQAEQFSADIVLERTRGDLTVTDENVTQALGLSDLRVGLNAQDGVWNFTAGLAGRQLGVLGGALVVRTSPQLAWPAADAPVQGVLEAQVANLGTWGSWVPAGWRLGGKLNISASLGGKFSAPEYTGEMKGSDIGVRNVVEGVNLTGGEVDISLRGDTAKINKFIAHGGAGTVRLEGDAKLDENWRAHLKLVADKFQALGRVDLRMVTSGEAQVDIDGETIKTEGRFSVDEGLVDFTRLNSPGLGDDVIVTGRSTDLDNPPAAAPASSNRMTVNLTVNLGKHLQMRGLGIDTRLTGELHVSRLNGKWALQGTVNAVDGTFANYGQKLVIDRGVMVFNGAPSDMRLDIEATRPNLDVRVGVQVTGPLQNLRVRLFSDPDMSNNDKLSWLLLGRASDGLGKTDTALVQRAAFALLAGDGDGGPGAITKAVGIDDVGVRQTDDDTRATVVSVGKQLSKRVYLAYEQNLATSAGSFQVTYRIAQRFVLRLQSGLDRSVDLIGTWRWE